LINLLEQTITYARRFIRWCRWGTVTSKAMCSIANVTCEVAYYDRFGREIGYWAYGSFDPSYPYQGDD